MLATIILAPGFRGVITAQQVSDLAAAIPTSVDNVLLLLVPFAQCYAIPPVSDYPVGVIAQGNSGSAYFGPSDLGVTAALMSPANNGLKLSPPPTDPVVQAALAAANASYAPYSKGYAGVAIATANGATYTGRYAENAAFNPSMSPLESALTMWSFRGNPDDAITKAVLVELPSPADQADVTAAVLATVSSAQLQVYAAIPPP